MQRVHALTIALMRESTLAGSVRRVVGSLREDFHTDHVRLVMFRADPELPAADWLIVQPQGLAALPEFAEFFRLGEPLCGRLQPEKLDALYGDQQVGMLAIGSADANRFHPGMGTLFVKLIADAAASAFARFARK